MTIKGDDLARMSDDPWDAVTARLDREEETAREEAARVRARRIAAVLLVASALVSIGGIAALVAWLI